MCVTFKVDTSSIIQKQDGFGFIGVVHGSRIQIKVAKSTWFRDVSLFVIISRLVPLVVFWDFVMAAGLFTSILERPMRSADSSISIEPNDFKKKMV